MHAHEVVRLLLLLFHVTLLCKILQLIASDQSWKSNSPALFRTVPIRFELIQNHIPIFQIKLQDSIALICYSNLHTVISSKSQKHLHIIISHAFTFLVPERAPLSLSRKSSILWFIFLKVYRSMLSKSSWHRPPPTYLNPSVQLYCTMLTI
jgi:hypothetical protein